MTLSIITLDKIELKEEKLIKFMTKRIAGEIDKVIVNYGEECSRQLTLRIFTEFGEKLLSVQKGRDKEIYYPRNWDVSAQRGEYVNLAPQGIASERFTCLGSLFIEVETPQENEVIEQIQIVIRGRILKENLVSTTKSKSELYLNIRKAMVLIHNGVKEEIEKEENRNVVLKATERERMLDTAADALFSRKFEKLNATQSNSVKDIIAKYIIAGKSTDATIQAIRRKLGSKAITEGETERIVRTEKHEARLSLKEETAKELDPEGEILQKWAGPQDRRTTPVCEEIKARTRNGVTLDRLKEILNEVSKKHGFTPREWTPHFNCRHIFRRAS